MKGFVVEDGNHQGFQENGTPHIRLWKCQLLKKKGDLLLFSKEF
jgi:hypothetical protein